MDKYAEAKEMARTCLGFTLEDGAEEIRLIAEYLSKVRNESAAEAFDVMVKHVVRDCPYCKGTPLHGCACRVMGTIAAQHAAALRAGAGEDAG